MALICCLANGIYGQGSKSNVLLHESFGAVTDSIFEKLVKIRRTFHEKPELAGKEAHTREIVKKYLLDIGLEVETDLYGYSVVGILKGAEKGKRIAWRADMDALPADLPDPVAFKSTVKGVQHGCGHDIHMAIALGIAEVLAKNRQSLQGTVYFIFQPEEETFTGAKKMVENGLITRYKPDEIYGLHVTAMPVGQIIVKQNEMFAYQKGIRIKLQNTLSKEAINELITKIRTALARTKTGAKPWEIQRMVDEQDGLTKPNTIFGDYLVMGDIRNYVKQDTLMLETELYETDKRKLNHIIPIIKKVIADNNHTAALLSVSFIKENPTVVNDKRLTNSAVKILEQVYGKGTVMNSYGQVPYFNDDFAYFQQQIPGIYFFLGGSNMEKGIIAMNHAPNFQVDEACIGTGVNMFASLIAERLK